MQQGASGDRSESEKISMAADWHGKKLDKLAEDIKRCTVCQNTLPLGARPVIAVGRHSKILIIGQAPGLAVHQTGIPWNDKSGNNLRQWLNVDKVTFYNTSNISIIPMGFCYPGKGKSGDQPPRSECAPLWHAQLLHHLPELQLTLLIGKYAQQYYLPDNPFTGLTETVQNAYRFLPRFFPLPHPSPRNNIWMARNPWFKNDILPLLRYQVKRVLN